MAINIDSFIGIPPETFKEVEITNQFQMSIYSRDEMTTEQPLDSEMPDNED